MGQDTRAEQAHKIWQILIAAARRRETLTYGQVAQQLGYGGAGVLGQPLDLVLYFCDRRGLPPLTCIVVTPTTGLPREGYPIDEQLFRDRERVYEHNWFTDKPPQTSDFEASVEEIAGLRRKRGLS